MISASCSLTRMCYWLSKNQKNQKIFLNFLWLFDSNDSLHLIRAQTGNRFLSMWHGTPLDAPPCAIQPSLQEKSACCLLDFYKHSNIDPSMTIYFNFPTNQKNWINANLCTNFIFGRQILKIVSEISEQHNNNIIITRCLRDFCCNLQTTNKCVKT